MSYGMKEWIRLFQHNDRFLLEETLNRFIQERDVSEIDVWVNQELWFAKVRYKFQNAPTYCKQDEECHTE